MEKNKKETKIKRTPLLDWQVQNNLIYELDDHYAYKLAQAIQQVFKEDQQNRPMRH